MLNIWNALLDVAILGTLAEADVALCCPRIALGNCFALCARDVYCVHLAL